MAGMDPQYALAAAPVGKRHHDLPIEPSGSQQRRIEHIRPVRSREYDDLLALIEPVHLHQDFPPRPVELQLLAASEVLIDARSGAGPESAVTPCRSYRPCGKRRSWLLLYGPCFSVSASSLEKTPVTRSRYSASFVISTRLRPLDFAR